MGCDIHMFCEELKNIDGVDKWVSRDYFELNPYFGMDEYESEYTVVGLCDIRDYSMFTALCGVRDYTDESPRISDPKGIPCDCSDTVMNEFKRWDGDCHSASYVTLREVKEFCDKNYPIKRTGLLTQEQSDRLDEGVLPDSWCQVSSIPMIRRNWEDSRYSPLDLLFELMVNRFNEWPVHCPSLDEMERFRVVFWFDN